MRIRVSIQPTQPWEPLLANLALVHFVFATGPSQSRQTWTLMRKGAAVLQYRGKWRDRPGMQRKSIATGYQCWIHSLEQVHSDLSRLKGTNQKTVIACSLVNRQRQHAVIHHRLCIFIIGRSPWSTRLDKLGGFSGSSAGSSTCDWICNVDMLGCRDLST